MGQWGTAGIGVCGPKFHSMSCWTLWQIGLDLIDHCVQRDRGKPGNAEGKMGGYASIEKIGLLGMYLDLLIYHS